MSFTRHPPPNHNAIIDYTLRHSHCNVWGMRGPVTVSDCYQFHFVARRPSGIPELDSSEAEGVELREVVIPQFETEYQKVCKEGACTHMIHYCNSYSNFYCHNSN